MNAGEINLIDLLAGVLLHWRMIILCMLVGGVLGFVSGKGEATDVSLPGQYLSEQEIQNVNWIVAYEKAYRAKRDYLEKSALMKIEPNLIWSSFG